QSPPAAGGGERGGGPGGGRGAPPARRDDPEHREYLSEEQRSRRGCIARRMQPEFRRGLPAEPSARTVLTCVDRRLRETFLFQAKSAFPRLRKVRTALEFRGEEPP